jgi:hypothetical protein
VKATAGAAPNIDACRPVRATNAEILKALLITDRVGAGRSES